MMAKLASFAAGCLIWASASAAMADSGKIIKVLPQFLDRDGRHGLSPSLYERDAYQAHLRNHPAEVSALRFAVQWKAKTKRPNDVTLRLEIEGEKAHRTEPLVIEKQVKPRWWRSRWSDLRLSREVYEQLGEVVAWKAGLWEGKTLLAEQKSFLW